MPATPMPRNKRRENLQTHTHAGIQTQNKHVCKNNTHKMNCTVKQAFLEIKKCFHLYAQQKMEKNPHQQEK